MHVELIRSGGFANVRFLAAFDDEALTSRERDELRALVAVSGFWSLAEVVPSGAPSPDRMRYRLTIQDGARRHSLTMDEQDVPDALRPLVTWLDARARPSPGAVPRRRGP